jgi:hypothetical protein
LSNTKRFSGFLLVKHAGLPDGENPKRSEVFS